MRVGFVASAMYSFLPELIGELSRELPGLSFEFLELATNAQGGFAARGTDRHRLPSIVDRRRGDPIRAHRGGEPVPYPFAGHRAREKVRGPRELRSICPSSRSRKSPPLHRRMRPESLRQGGLLAQGRIYRRPIRLRPQARRGGARLVDRADYLASRAPASAWSPTSSSSSPSGLSSARRSGKTRTIPSSCPSSIYPRGTSPPHAAACGL